MKYLQRVLRIEKNLPAVKKKDLNLKVIYLEGSEVVSSKPAGNESCETLKVEYV